MLFYNCYKNSDNIVIPNVYQYFTNYNNNVIVMDFIEGLNASQLTNEDKIKFAPVYNFFYNDSIFVKHICHSDLHIGNVIFIKTSDNEYKIGLYDFGLIYKLTKQESKKLFKLLTMLSNNNRRGVIETLVDFSLLSNNKDKQLFLVESLLTKDIFLHDKPMDFHEINIIFQEGYKHNLQINKNTSAILLSFISSLYLSKIFADNKSITKTFKNFLYNDTIICN
jgi:predicted unusual protein kinase regulating ubiquinone biosynthesis (AarF/ABC1/UbiB family)